MNRRNFVRAAVPLALAGGAARAAAPQPCAPPRTADVVYEPTPLAVVETLIGAANVGANDTVYDLGCGDGRIVIAAARRGASGLGFDLDPKLVEWAQANALAERVDGRVKFLIQDLFLTDLSPATVIALYILPEMNRKLRPKLWRELKVGSRVVANGFEVPGWKPDRVVDVPTRYLHAFLYTVKPEDKAAT